MAPRPAAAQIEFFFATGRRVRIVKVHGREDNSELPQQFVEDTVTIGQPREFNAVPVHIQNDGLVARDDELSKVPELRGIAAEELNQFVGVIQ